LSTDLLITDEQGGLAGIAAHNEVAVGVVHVRAAASAGGVGRELALVGPRQRLITRRTARDLLGVANLVIGVGRGLRRGFGPVAVVLVKVCDWRLPAVG